MSGLPESWIQTTLGQVINYADNKTTDPDNLPNDAWLVELEDIERDTSKLLIRKTVAERSPKSSKNRFDAGDVLYGKLRPYLNKVVRADQSGYCSSEIIAISPGLIDKDYLFYSMRTPSFLQYVSSVSHGVRMPRLGTQQANGAPFVLPPVAEQTRIAAKLDELLAHVDTLKARIDGIPELLKRLRQSVLAAAVSGRLTEDWRGGSAPKSESSMPESWVLTRLDQCVQAQNGKAFPSADYKNDGIRLIRPGNLHVSGRVVWNDSNTVCLDKAHMAGSDRYFVRAGDIVMNLTAQSLKDDFLGRVCVYADEFPALLNQRQCVFVFEDDSPLLREYLFWYFRSPQFRAFVDTLDSGSLIKHMYTKQLAGHEVAIPTVEEQTEIVRRVDQLFAFADQLESRVKTAEVRIDRLTQSILAKAFRGELVPQDPNDEPASVLLERIKAQRAAAPKVKRGRKVSA